MIPQFAEFYQKFIEGVKVNPLFAVGLAVLAVIFIAIAANALKGAK